MLRALLVIPALLRLLWSGLKVIARYLGIIAAGSVYGTGKWFANRSVAFTLITALGGMVVGIPLSIWAVAESRGIAFGILTADPWAGAPGHIPWILGIIDVFVPIVFLTTCIVVSVLVRFVTVNLGGFAAAFSKFMSTK